MFYKYRCLDPAASWAVLLFDPVLLTGGSAVFCSTNAASSLMYNRTIEERRKIGSFAGLFNPEVQTSRGTVRRIASHQPCWPTDVQAEVLVPGMIHSDYCRGIIFDSTRSRENWLKDAQLYRWRSTDDRFFFDQRPCDRAA